MLFADHALARRLEAVEARGARECALALARLRPDSGAAVEAFGGGQAAFLGRDSPLTQVMGAGMDGPVAPAEIDRMESFYLERGAAAKVDLCPLADGQFALELGRRGYHVSTAKNMLVRPLGPDESFPPAPDGITVAEVDESDADLCAQTVARSFSEGKDPSAAYIETFTVIGATSNATRFLARVGDELVGGGSMAIHEGVVALFGGGTLPSHRGHGVHAALLHARLNRAIQTQCGSGCDLAMVTMYPGAQSQRNVERLGFQVAYTRMTLTREWR